jgi:hypothetical protein
MKIQELICEYQPLEPHGDLQSDVNYVYHATNIYGLYDILESGFIDVFPPDHGTDQDEWPDGSTDNRAYFSKNASVVWSFAPEDGQPVIIRVPEAEGSFKKERGTGDMYTTQPVPADKSEYLSKDNNWYPLANIKNI